MSAAHSKNKKKSQISIATMIAVVSAGGGLKVSDAKADQSCAKDPYSPKGTVEVTTAGMEKMLRIGTDELLQYHFDDLLKEVPKSFSYPDAVDKKKCALDKIAKMTIEKAYDACPGIPYGLVSSTGNSKDPRRQSTDLKTYAQVEPATFKVDQLKIKDLKFSTPEIKCEKDECRVKLSLNSLSIGGNMTADSIHDGHRLMGIKDWTAQVGAPSGTNGSPALEVEFKAKVMPNGAMGPLVEVSKTDLLAPKPGSISFDVNLTEKEKAQAFDAIRTGKDLPKKFETVESLDAYTALQVGLRALKTPGISKIVTQAVSEKATEILNRKIQEINQIPIVQQQLQQVVPMPNIQQLIDLKTMRDASDAIKKKSGDYLSRMGSAPRLSSTVMEQLITHPDNKANLADFLKMVRQSKDPMVAPIIEEQIQHWNRIRSGILDLASGRRPGSWMALSGAQGQARAEATETEGMLTDLNKEWKRLRAIADGAKTTVQVGLAAEEANSLKSAMDFLIATCLPCYQQGKMDQPQTRPFGGFKQAKDYDLAVHVSWDAINAGLKAAHQSGVLEGCMVLTETPKTCTTAGPNDPKAIWKFSEPIRVGFKSDGTAQDKADGRQGAYVDVQGARVRISNVSNADVIGGWPVRQVASLLVGENPKLHAGGQIYASLKASANGRGLETQGKKIDFWAFYDQKDGKRVDDGILSFLTSDFGESFYQDAVLRQVNQQVGDIAGVTFKKAEADKDGVKVYLGIDDQIRKNIPDELR